MSHRFIDTFINAWWIAVHISHNKAMECLNNPTPEVVASMVHWKDRLRRLHRWSTRRWGFATVGKLIFEREFRKQSIPTETSSSSPPASP